MRRRRELRFEFVEFIPDALENGVLYVSVAYATAAHKCACGCGHEVNTPLSPTDWKLIFDGETVSLSPSIGNWSFPCRSHYWVRRNRVQWAESWSDDRVTRARRMDAAAKDAHYASREELEQTPNDARREPERPTPPRLARWRRFVRWLFDLGNE